MELCDNISSVRSALAASTLVLIIDYYYGGFLNVFFVRIEDYTSLQHQPHILHYHIKRLLGVTRGSNNPSLKDRVAIRYFVIPLLAVIQ